MKRMISLLVIAALMMTLFTGCCLKHDWEDATCDDPKTCAECGKTEGDPLDHEWEDATCAAPKTCTLCGKTRGKALDHSWEPATCAHPIRCTECGKTDGAALEHTVDSWTVNGDKMEGSCTECGAKVSREGTPEELAGALLVGYWTGSWLSDGNTTVDADAGSYVEFYEDGTCSVSLGDDPWYGTWEFYDHLDDEACLFYFANIDDTDFNVMIFDDELDTLYLESDGLILCYIR